MFGKCYKGPVPMLRGCCFPECATLTLGDYCLEHELFLRADLEAEGTQHREGAEAEVAAGRQATA